MKKLFILLICFLVLPVFAQDENISLAKEQEIQTRIDKIGTNILNCNKIPKRIVFVYNKKEKKKALTTNKALTKRQVIIYDGLYQSAQSNDELAGILAREIAVTIKSYSGMWGGRIDAMQVALGSKKFELVSDKRAVDFMVKAGYNPLGLIVHIHKFYPQKRSDLIARHNLTSKRLARIYEYITYKYPEYLNSPDYLQNEYYQINSKSTKEIKYE